MTKDELDEQKAFEKFRRIKILANTDAFIEFLGEIDELDKKNVLKMKKAKKDDNFRFYQGKSEAFEEVKNIINVLEDSV